MPRVYFALVALAATSACGSSESAASATPDVDAGGSIADSGSAPVDAGGAVVDAGASSGDAGAAGCDLAFRVQNTSAKVNATSISAWTCAAGVRTMTGNGIPDHAVVGGNFATPVGAQSLTVRFPLAPTRGATTTTPLRQAVGYVLNSVKLDPVTDGTCSSTATSTQRGGGCVAVMGRDPWNIEAMGGAFTFGTDENNAHTQPNGQYHYHGMPEGYVARQGSGARITLVGYAVDGFPVYARYGYATATDAASAVRVMKGSYRTKATPNAGRPSTTTFPMGTFTQDWEYVDGLGDLDECNGRTGVTPEYPQGTYHYYITDTYPFIQRCYKGTPL